ncbi:MAG: hypothetical protein ISS28_05295 [Candidatus Cloacimonetes bacterium]|nr:hypothetical protein [Candidatus Cloacimonadota bacterium]MBL7086495.1 hypothetical protein [Candidatus Cloacimonadota bacterium]
MELLNNLINEKSINYKKFIGKFTSIKCDLFNIKIFPLVPLYITSYCYEDCKYCNFRVNNNVLRKRLNDNQLIKETELLIKKGFRVIELVYSSDPEIKITSVCNHIKILKKTAIES